MKRVQFEHSAIPYLFIAPQILIITVFFLWPAAQAIFQSFLLQDAFGLSSQFVWFKNYGDTILSSSWLQAAGFTMVFSALVTFLSLALALFLAVKANEVIHGARSYKTLLMWAYAIAPPVAGLMGNLMFNPLIGDVYKFLNAIGWDFDHKLDPFDAGFVVVLIAVWKQVSVNFIFFLSGLQGIPKSVTEEPPTLDCQSPTRRFLDHRVPASRTDHLLLDGDQTSPTRSSKHSASSIRQRSVLRAVLQTPLSTRFISTASEAPILADHRLNRSC